MRRYGHACSQAILHLFCAFLFTLCAAAGAQVTLPAGVVIKASNTTYDNKDIIVDGTITGTAIIDGRHPFKSLTLLNGGVVTHDPPSSPNYAGGMNLVIAGDCNVTVGCSISATGMGWAGGSGSLLARGPGAGKSDSSGSGSGGAYGGEVAGPGGGAVYDDLTLKTPTDLGSGGGSGVAGQYPGGNGGGAIEMTVNGTLQVDGAIVADGAAGDSPPYSGVVGGGGSGGSLYLMVGTLSGAGYISASGGNTGGYGGAGSGGRIAIHYATNSFAAPLTTAGYQIRAAGGSCSYGFSGAGTVFLQQVGQAQGDLWVHNQGNGESAYTPLKDALTFDDVYIWGQGVLASRSGCPLLLNVMGNVDIAIDGLLSVSGRGYAGGYGPFPARGPGAGKSDSSGSGSGSGGAYGGEVAGPGGGAVYDDLTLKTPTDLGSGGGSGVAGQYPGGNGGGAIEMTVNGTLQVDGAIVADGAAGDSPPYSGVVGGGGSGGSLYLMVGTLSGAGYISASGGNTGGYGGAGSGGRIAIHYATNSFAAPLTTAGYQIRAAGGSCSYGFSGAGTVFLQQVGQAQGDLWVHNQGNGESAYTPLKDALTFDDIYIWGQGVLTSAYGSPLTLMVLGTIDIGVDGYLSVYAHGYSGGIGSRRAGGPGAGASDLMGYGGGGGGYGGAGDADGVNFGGSVYGSVTLPSDLGSGGGSGYQGFYAGGNGGGAIHAIVNGTLQVDGSLIADGQGANNGGGGSGGSLWLVTNTLSGAGLISASGGSANNGGAGGGGRIAIYTFANNFSSGTIRAPGGSDGGSAQAGTANVYPISGISLQTLSLAATTLPEGQYGTTTGSVTLSGPAPAGGVTIALTTSNTTVATVPPSVTIAAGQQGVTFPISANASGTAGSVTIGATLGGVVQTVTLNVLPWIAEITLDPPAVSGGTASTGTLTLNFPAPQNGLPVTLASDDTSVATVTGSVNVPQGATSVTFHVSTSSSVTAETSVDISAIYGPEEFYDTLYVDPSKTMLKTLTLSPATLIGGNVCVGTVSLNGKAPAGGAVVALSSANPGLVSVPDFVTVPEGQSQIAFLIPTPQVTANQSVILSATLGTVTRTATLQIKLTGVATLTLVPNSVQGGFETSAGIVTLQSAVSTSTVVHITSSSSLAIPNATVVIPAGSLVGIFYIDTMTNATGKPVTATITATANGISQKASLTIH